MTTITRSNANAARPIAEKFSLARTGNVPNYKNVMQDISQPILREKSRCLVIPSEARKLIIAVAITPATLCDAAANARSFALLRMTTQHVSQLISREKSTHIVIPSGVEESRSRTYR